MDMLTAVSTSPAHKLLIPKPEEGWDWAGVSQWESETAVKQTIRAIKQLIAGQAVKAKKGYGLGTVIAVVAGILVLLNLLPILFVLPMFMFGY